MKKLVANLVECQESLTEELQEVFSGHSIFSPEMPKSDLKGLGKKALKLKKFVKKIAALEGFNPPKLIITSEEEGGSAHGIKNYSSVIILCKDEILNDYKLKQAKSIILHELAHIKYNDPLWSSVAYWIALSFYACLFYGLIFMNFTWDINLILLSTLFIPSFFLKWYNHFTEFRADKMVKKYGLSENFIDTFDEEDFEEEDCFTHPSVKDRAQRLNS